MCVPAPMFAASTTLSSALRRVLFLRLPACRLSVLDWSMHRVRMTALVVSQAAPHPFASEFSAAMVFLMRVWRALVEVGVVKDGFVDGC